MFEIQELNHFVLQHSYRTRNLFLNKDKQWRFYKRLQTTNFVKTNELLKNG